MAVILSSPHGDKQVGDEYSGADEDWLLANGYAFREGYEGPGVASTGPTDVPESDNPQLAEHREGSDIDVNDGHSEQYQLELGKVDGEEVYGGDDQEVVAKVSGDHSDHTYVGGDDKGSVNVSDEAAPFDEQLSAQNKVRGYTADGEPITETGDPLEAVESTEVKGEKRRKEEPKGLSFAGGPIKTEAVENKPDEKIQRRRGPRKVKEKQVQEDGEGPKDASSS